MPLALRAEIEREIARLALVKQQIKALEDAQRVEVEAGGRPIVSQWFNQRFAGSGKRSRRVRILALAKRPLMALWRYLDRGEIPAGSELRPIAV